MLEFTSNCVMLRPGPTPDKGLRANYTILRSLDQGASWEFLQVVFAAGSGYSDMQLLPSATADTGDLIGMIMTLSRFVALSVSLILKTSLFQAWPSRCRHRRGRCT